MDEDRNHVLASKFIFGLPGMGKTVLLNFFLTDYFDNPPAKAIGGRPKVILIDTTGRAEISNAFCPMLPANPLYSILTHQINELPDGSTELFRDKDGVEREGVNPRGYPIEIRIPLWWSLTGPALAYRQPSMVKPYVFAIDELSALDWTEFLDLPEGTGAGYLHQKILADGDRAGWLKTGTVEKMAVIAERLAAKRRGKRKLYTDTQLRTVDAHYSRLAETRLVMPKHPPWDETGQELPWLNMPEILSDTSRITIFSLDFTSNKPLMARILTVLLDMILMLKDQNNPKRIKNPVVIGIPDISEVAKPSFDTKEPFMDPVKARILRLYGRGAGDGICIIGDTQNVEDLDPRFSGKASAVAIFQTEKDAIRDLLKSHSISNRDEFQDTLTTSQLRKSGTFIWCSPESRQAEFKSGAIPRWEYPRYRLASGETEFNYLNLWPRIYPKKSNPDKYIDLAPTYGLVDSIRRYAVEEQERERLQSSGEAKDEPAKADFPPEARKRLEALCRHFEPKKAVQISIKDIIGAMGDTAQGTDETKYTMARKLMMSLTKPGLVVLRPIRGRMTYWIDLDKLRRALVVKDLQSPPEPDAPTEELDILLEDLGTAVVRHDVAKVVAATMTLGEYMTKLESDSSPEAESNRKRIREFMASRVPTPAWLTSAGMPTADGDSEDEPVPGATEADAGGEDPGTEMMDAGPDEGQEMESGDADDSQSEDGE